MVYYNPDINKFWVIDYRIFSPEHDGATKVEHLLNMLNNAVYSKKIQDPRYNQLGFHSIGAEAGIIETVVKKFRHDSWAGIPNLLMGMILSKLMPA